MQRSDRCLGPLSGGSGERWCNRGHSRERPAPASPCPRRRPSTARSKEHALQYPRVAPTVPDAEGAHDDEPANACGLQRCDQVPRALRKDVCGFAGGGEGDAEYHYRGVLAVDGGVERGRIEDIAADCLKAWSRLQGGWVAREGADGVPRTQRLRYELPPLGPVEPITRMFMIQGPSCILKRHFRLLWALSRSPRIADSGGVQCHHELPKPLISCLRPISASGD